MTQLKSSKFRYILLILVGWSLIIFPGCAPEEKKQEEGSDRAPVSVFNAKKESIRETVTEVGELEATDRIHIRARTEGEILSSNFEEGSYVAEGEKLFALEDELQTREVQGRRRALEQVKTNLQNARKTYERKKTLFQRGLAPKQVYDDAEAKFKSLKSRVAQLRSQLKAAQKRLDDTELKAPFPGIIGEKLVDSGEVVSPGQKLAVLQQVEPLEVKLAVPEKYAGRVREGDSLEVKPAAGEKEKFTGRVTYISPEISPATRNLVIKGKIDNANGTLKPGGYAQTTLVLRVCEENPVIPARALVGVRDGYVVYRVEEGRVSRESVRIGIRKPGRVEILEGVQEGDLLVEAGHELLEDGAKVSVENFRGAPEREN